MMDDFLVHWMLMVDNQKGQSAVEFILTFSFALGVTFLFVNQALNITSGYLVHYVNFMSARAYLVHDGGINAPGSMFTQAKNKAIQVFESYNISEVGVDATLEVFSPNDNNGLFTGTVMQFEKRLSALPVVGGGKKALFYSESFLGKEPLRITCAKMICAAMTGNQDTCASRFDNTDMALYDNGC